MSYCVNCGVKLKNSEEYCPLCHTKVINPNELNKVINPTYSNNIEIINKINIKFLFKIVSFCFVAVALILLTTDLIITHKITFSLYVIASLLYTTSLFQYLIRKNIYIAHVINFISMELFLFLICLLSNILNVYLKLIMIFIIILWGYIILFTALIKHKKTNFMRKIAYILFITSVSVMLIDIAINLFVTNSFSITWSLKAFIPIISVGLILFILSFNKRIVDALLQKLFV